MIYRVRRETLGQSRYDWEIVFQSADIAEAMSAMVLAHYKDGEQYEFILMRGRVIIDQLLYEERSPLSELIEGALRVSSLKGRI